MRAAYSIPENISELFSYSWFSATTTNSSL